MVATPRRASFLTQLALKNIKSFAGEQVLDLTDRKGNPARWTLLLGDNGVGKTTLLECLAHLVPAFNDAAEGDEGGDPHFEPRLIQKENTVTEALGRVGERECQAKATFAINTMLDREGSLHSVEMSVSLIAGQPKAESIEFSRWPTKDDATGANKSEIPRFEPPLILAYGAGRHMGIGNLDFDLAPEPTASLFSGSIELFDVDELLQRLDHASKGIGAPARKARVQMNVLRETIAALLPGVGSAGKITVYPPSAIGVEGKAGTYVQTADGEVPLHQLSFGYQTMMAWAVDIGWRLFAHHPTSKKPLNEPVIVLIDELDLHLHPSWQRQIRALLTAYFPNAQFIATAHSPLMAQAFLDANLAVVLREGDHSVIENDPVKIENWKVDQIVTSDLFGLPSPWPPAVDKMFEEYERLMTRTNRTPREAQSLKNIEAEMLNLPTEDEPADDEAFKLIREAAKDLKPRVRKA
jgi:predicted ATP-binding protein involved in virulence